MITRILCLIFAATAAHAQVDVNLLARLMTKYKSERKAFEFALVGDHPYGAEGERKWPAMMNSINRSAAEFVTHNGDFKNGSSVCSNQVFEDRLQKFEASEKPFIYTPGDNDWTDCHRANNGSYDPLERLDLLRRMFYRDNFSQGRRKIEVVRQSEDPRFTKFRENAIWAHGSVVFATLHVVGSNNNLLRNAENDAEYRERNFANLYWLRTIFALARDGDFDGVCITMQADMEWYTAPTALQRLGFNDTINVMAQEAAVYRKPIIISTGDTHQLLIDKPLVGLRSNRRIENFTRIQNFSDLDSHWLKVKVDPALSSLFVIEPVIVPENVFAAH
ncbi:MAG: metallophosphoesterase family protein [Bryobacteraceae bacterium]|nr:metallophosphoesterase family protein [Bryobacteraceae bacterium]